MKSWKACKVDGLDMIDYFSKTKEKGTKKGKLKNGLQVQTQNNSTNREDLHTVLTTNRQTDTIKVGWVNVFDYG